MTHHSLRVDAGHRTLAHVEKIPTKPPYRWQATGGNDLMGAPAASIGR